MCILYIGLCTNNGTVHLSNGTVHLSNGNSSNKGLLNKIQYAMIQCLKMSSVNTVKDSDSDKFSWASFGVVS